MEHFQILWIHLMYPSEKEPTERFGEGMQNMENDLLHSSGPVRFVTASLKVPPGARRNTG